MQPGSGMFLRITIISFAVVAHIPIAVEYCLRMWRADHYQFFPLLVLGTGWYFLSDKEEIFQATDPADDRIALSLLSIVGMLALLATSVNSSFLGAISLWLLTASSIYWLSGNTGLSRSLPLLLLLILIIPLPARWDELLIFKFQFLASNLASLILDGLGLLHFREGVILITENDRFLTEEACSGIRSLFSSLAGIGFYCLVNYYPIWRYFFNFLQTIFWVIAGNALRIAFVVFVSDQYTKAIATGVGHDLFGLIVFGIIMLAAISTDRLLQAFLNTGRSSSFAESEATPVSKSDGTNDSVFKTRLLARISRPVFAPFLLLFFSLVIGLGAFIGIKKIRASDGVWIRDLPRLPQPDSSELVVSQWQVVDFEHLDRERGGIQAEESSIWTLRNQELTAKFSLDCPWDDWHDLSHCYSGLGWSVELRHVFDQADSKNAGYSLLNMHKPTGEKGIVFFSSVDNRGNEVVPRFTGGYFSLQSTYRQMIETVSQNVGLQDDDISNTGIGLPVTTFQLVFESTQIPTEQEVESLKSLFVECRNSVLNSKRFLSKTNLEQ